jgi:N-acetylmuramoyl-L-alanine amidase
MRPINKIIIHCSATPEGRDVKIDTIRQWHIDKGWADIGYHYVIELDGQIQAGRPVELLGAHCLGQNKFSIGVCYVGGMDKK